MAKIVTLYGQEYEMSDELINYVNVRKEFEDLSERQNGLFKKELSEKCKDADLLVEQGEAIAKKYFKEAENVILTHMAERDIFTIKEREVSELADECEVKDCFYSVFNELSDNYYAIEESAQEERDMREQRKESRGRFVGGGYGLQGAIKGSVEAGALNLVTGASHSFVNFVGNSMTEHKKEKDLKKIYLKYFNGLCNAFSRSICLYHVVLMSLYEQYNLMKFEIPSEENEEKAEAILENLKAGRIPVDKKENYIFQLITLNPFHEESYYFVLSDYGDLNNELEVAGNAFGIDVSSIKSKMIDSEFSFELLNIHESFEFDEKKDLDSLEKKLVSLLQRIKDKKQKFGFNEATSYEKDIDDTLKKYRTYRNVEFESFVQADNARKDYDRFYMYVKTYGLDTTELREILANTKFESDYVEKNINVFLDEIRKNYSDYQISGSEKSEIEKRLSDEYMELESSIEPIKSVILNHIDHISSNDIDYRIMKWDCDLAVVKDEKAPILVVVKNANCNTKLLGKLFIRSSAANVLGKTSDFVYLLNKEKFIIYITGNRKEWKLSEIDHIIFKSGLLGASFTVVKNSGIQEKISIDRSFGEHVKGLDDLIYRIKNLDTKQEQQALDTVSSIQTENAEINLENVADAKEVLNDSIPGTSEYESIRQKVAPLMPLLTSHDQSTKDRFENHRILCWNGDPTLIENAGTPIYASIRSFRCAPNLSGDNYIDQKAEVLLGKDTEIFYIITTDKFIVYEKGLKYIWNINDINVVNFKTKLLSSELHVVENNGNESVIKVSCVFQKHINGINAIIGNLRGII